MKISVRRFSVDIAVKIMDSEQSDSSKQPAKAGRRGKNWSPEEDKVLCYAWLDISQDPIISVDQKGDTFYDRIFLKFNEICQDKRLPVDPTTRSATSLKARWGVIQKSVNKFCGCYAQVQHRNRSGVSVADQLTEAFDLYKAETKSNFTLLYAYNILEPAKKWKDLTREKENLKVSSKRKAETNEAGDLSQRSDCQNENVDVNVPSTSAGKSNRPTGRKAAKQEANNSSKLNILISNSSSLMESGQILADVAKEKSKHNIQRTNALMRLANHNIMSVDLEKMSETSRQYYEMEQKRILQELQNDTHSTMSTP